MRYLLSGLQRYNSSPEINVSPTSELGKAPRKKRKSRDARSTPRHCVNACVHVFPGINVDQSSLKGGGCGRERDRGDETE